MPITSYFTKNNRQIAFSYNPTLCELCHLPIQKNQLDGTSFVPILTNLKAKIKDQVYIQWEGGDNAVSNRYNYAEWKQKEKIHSRMLFDHHIDPEEKRTGSTNESIEAKLISSLHF